MRRACVCGATLLVLTLALEAGARAGFVRLRSSPAPPVFVQHDAQLGWANRPATVSRHRARDFDVEVSVNAHGLRGAPWPGPRAARPRVLVLGDSAAFGWGVEDDECFSGRLAKLRPEWDVLNAGVVGYGSGQELLRLLELLPVVRPDAVVVVFSANDPLETRSRVAYGLAKPLVTIRAGRMHVEGTPIPAQPLWERSRLWREVRRLRSHRAALARARDPEADLRLTCALYREMHRRAGVPLLVVSSEDALAEFAARSTGIGHLHLAPHLAPLGTGARFEHDPHWTPAAHAAIARALGRELGRRLP